ncbi:TIGR03089 family protein [Paractinoplanes lichenicola]|uniref:TIGR03089 family protein n=1 Tax=Paractinoplanes lichenicola TaxID=2802976 RepID=A0ABS1VQE8_9ACTN|nr:TIGR03089 family protein [Actinoplanes lichenicola]MBL7256828.1 TIGR03089 family protein [Actinoplanes lichenicola]
METTIPQVLASAVRRDPASPLLTFYDDKSGDRTELSGATLDNWVSKTANLLVDGLGLGSGETAAVALPPHWQTAAILLGVWSAGVTATINDPESADVLFATPDQSTTTKAPDRYATGLLPFAMPLRELPAGFADYVLEVRQFGDHFPGAPVAAADRALGNRTHAEVIAAAQARATELGITAGGRVLIDATPLFDPLDWLVAPLVTGASIVLCANLDPAKVTSRAESEKVTLVVA